MFVKSIAPNFDKFLYNFNDVTIFYAGLTAKNITQLELITTSPL